MFIHFAQQFDWPSGPKIITYDNIRNTKLPVDKNGRVTCSKVWDTTAQFLFPWQPGNAFHSMNDNSLYILTHIIMQYITSFDYTPPATSSTSSSSSSSYTFLNNSDEVELLHMIKHILPHDRTLFVFNQSPQHEGALPSNTYKLLKLFFGTHVYPAKQVLTNGPHCITHVTWGNGYVYMYMYICVWVCICVYYFCKNVSMYMYVCLYCKYIYMFVLY